MQHLSLPLHRNRLSLIQMILLTHFKAEFEKELSAVEIVMVTAQIH